MMHESARLRRRKFRPPFLPADLRRRRLTPEIMDDPGLDVELHRQALGGLDRLHLITRSHRMLWPPIERELRRSYGRKLVLVDIACGGGRHLAQLHKLGRGRLECHGIDISPVALRHARGRLPKSVRLHQGDIVYGDWPTPESPDIVTCSLFLHHLEEEQIVHLLERVRRQTRRLFLAADLERSRLAWWSIGTGARLLTRSPVVHQDAVWSVEAAFRPFELRRLAEKAGMLGARVDRPSPFRLLLHWRPERQV